MGATQVCLTVRHVDGFALWPTKSNDYSVAASPWRNGTGDVVADFVASARKFGISPCFYVILGFNTWANYSGVPGPEYLQQQVTVLTELLTNYGHIDRLWWDNYALGSEDQPVTHEGFVCPGDHYDPVACPSWKVMIDTARALSPLTALIPGPDGCLVNGETSGGTYPLYHATATPSGAYSCAADSSVPSGGPTFTIPESDFSLTNKWFWIPGDPFASAEYVLTQYNAKLGQGATIIFNVPPNTSGVIPQEYVQVLADFAAARASNLAHPAAQLQAPVSAPCAALSVVLPVSAPFDSIAYAEDLRGGQVFANYSVEVSFGGGEEWLPLVDGIHGQTIGVALLDLLPSPIMNATALRFNCTADLAPPPAVQYVNAASACLSTPDGEAFPCWTGGVGPFSLCPLVAASSCAGPASVWASRPHSPWQPQTANASWAGTYINIDCDVCAVGTHAKLIAGVHYASALTWDAEASQIRVDSCPGLCLTNGIAPGALPSCAGNEPWSPTMVHIDNCA